MFKDKECRDCDKTFTPLNAKQVRCPDCIAQDRVPCTECGGLHRPGTDGRCHPCGRSNPRLNEAPVIPTLAELPGRQKTELCKFTLKLAGKALGNAQGLDGYVSHLVTFAEKASTGRVPSEDWQLTQLGHLMKIGA